MDTYIIRVYRRSKNSPEEIIGTSEYVETGERREFKDLKKLCEIISNPKSGRKKYKKGRSPSNN